jgi:hypothetical protein
MPRTTIGGIREDGCVRFPTGPVRTGCVRWSVVDRSMNQTCRCANVIELPAAIIALHVHRIPAPAAVTTADTSLGDARMI